MNDALIKSAIDKQIEKNIRLNLLYENIEDILHVDKSFSDVFAMVRDSGVEDLEDIIDYTVEKTISAIYSINQFIHITAEQKRELYNIYKESWETFDSDSPEQSILEHHKRLSQWISNLYPCDFTAVLRTKDQIGSVVNAQYSAEFQMKVLALELKNLMEPIIDIGCGSQANLVRHICKQKNNVLGIDRIIDYKSEHTKEIDWLDFQFPPCFYGTIIANMSFANHVVYHMQNKTPYLQAYLSKYKEILESLKQGGVFVYAPSLPFIEEMLDNTKYSVKVTDWENNNKVTKIQCRI